MAAWYNENDPKTAAWLRELIKAGLIADGEVDTRSIVDVQPDDIRGFVQCHFFAGIGGWSYALRLAGWPDERAVWTGSCPCQPFSSAGKGDGAADPRHLWPTWFGLIRQCAPSVVFGEQVASADGRAWLDRVSADVEACNYAIGAVDLPAGCVGAPHIRQRFYFVADAQSAAFAGRTQSGNSVGGSQAERARSSASARRRGGTGRMADANGGQSSDRELQPGRRHDERQKDAPVGGLADAQGQRGQVRAAEGRTTRRSTGRSDIASRLGYADDGIAIRAETRSCEPSDSGAWSDVVWVPCADGKARPIKPGIEPLVDGLSGRLDMLRGYGNAIVPQVAAEVIAAYMEIVDAK